MLTAFIYCFTRVRRVCSHPPPLANRLGYGSRLEDLCWEASIYSACHRGEHGLIAILPVGPKLIKCTHRVRENPAHTHRGPMLFACVKTHLSIPYAKDDTRISSVAWLVDSRALSFLDQRVRFSQVVV